MYSGRPRRRPPRRTRRTGWASSPASPYSAAGTIEAAHRFAIGARGVTGWRRRMLVGVGLLFPVTFGIALVVLALRAVF